MESSLAPVTLTHLGGPTVVIDYAGLRIVSDPAFDPAGSRYKVSGLLPLTKTTDPAIAADKLGKVDVVLISHDTHADNYDAAGRELTARVAAAGGAVITNGAALRALDAAIRLVPWASTKVEAPGDVTVTVTGAPARHAHGPVALIAGPVTGFILEAPGHPTVYLSGDNISAKATARVAARYRPDVAIMHAGLPRFAATGPIPFCMTAAQVADAVVTLGTPRTLVVHSDGWNHFRETEADVAAAFASGPLAKARIAAPLGKAVTV